VGKTFASYPVQCGLPAPVHHMMCEPRSVKVSPGSVLFFHFVFGFKGEVCLLLHTPNRVRSCRDLEPMRRITGAEGNEHNENMGGKNSRGSEYQWWK